MNAVEIEEAVSALASSPFTTRANSPTPFWRRSGTKKRRSSGCAAARPNRPMSRAAFSNGIIFTLPSARPAKSALRSPPYAMSPRTTAAKAKFVLATDGVELEAEDLASGETIACAYGDFARRFGFFLPLAGISTVRQITNNPIDIKATGRLNKLYVELLKDNEDWGTDARRHELNQFMARLIFCFFAEDTGIFLNHLFTKTIEQMSGSQSG